MLYHFDYLPAGLFNRVQVHMSEPCLYGVSVFLIQNLTLSVFTSAFSYVLVCLNDLKINVDLVQIKHNSDYVCNLYVCL